MKQETKQDSLLRNAITQYSTGLRSFPCIEPTKPHRYGLARYNNLRLTNCVLLGAQADGSPDLACPVVTCSCTAPSF